MTRRQSIEIEGFHHGGAPIPAACRVGNVLMTGGVYGLDTATGALPDDAGEQSQLMFANLRRILEAGGASLDDVVKMNVNIKGTEARAALNEEWLKAFPDPHARPARHTVPNDLLPANMKIQCDVTAILDLDAR